MSKEKHRSPRAAIKRWLRKSEGHIAGSDLFAPFAQSAKPTDLDQHRTKISHRDPTTKQPGKKHKSRHGSRHRGHSSKVNPTLPTISSRHDACDSKERLNNHFLLPNDTPIPSQIHTQDYGYLEGRQRASHGLGKRKRPISSQTTSLRSAALTDIHGRDDVVRRKLTVIAHDDPQARSLLSRSNVSTFSSSLCASPPPLKSYERRPRHKTREDRYEMKQTRKSKRESNAVRSFTQRSKRRKGKEKSGAAHIHNFKAPNVSHDRLTVTRGSM